MSFGGFNSFSTPTPSGPPGAPPPLSAADSRALRMRVQSSISQQANIMNAKILIEKVTETCFAYCVPNPSSSLSSKEQTCLSSCMEKYIDAWNVTSRTYIQRLQKEGAQMSATGMGGGQQPGGGKELF